MTRVMIELPLDLRMCIDTCTDCHSACLSLIGHCLRKGGDHSDADHIRLLEDCTEICEITADFILRGSEFHHRLSVTCAEICDRCAADCERFSDDAAMKECAEACRKCADACRKISA